MLVLGLIDSKPSAAALLQDGEIIAAVAEERLCRLKMADGMPRLAIQEVMRIAGIGPSEIEHVGVAQQAKMFMPESVPWSGWFNEDKKSQAKRSFDWLSAKLAPQLGSFPLAWQAHHQFKRYLTRHRVEQIPALLKSAYQIQAPVTFYDHHYCHATSAYYTSGFDEALVVTLDGGGDGKSGSVYMAKGDLLKLIATVDSFNSLGNFYSYITELCGFRAEKHEGKITGLAALGKPIYADILREFIEYREPGQIRYKIPMYHASALQAIRAKLPNNFEIPGLAASVQLVLEEIGAAFIAHWMGRTGQRNIALAGGVFANVKFNQCIHELAAVENIFIHPAMDDSGLSVGSALAVLAERHQIRTQRDLPNVYLGNGYTDDELASAVLESGCPTERPTDLYARIAQLLADGHVVARFSGRMEYGPRALGHRTILYQTTDPSVNDWLNVRLKRTEFMPFAPATLVEHADACYIGLDGARDPARFMTITFNCTEAMVAQSPGVVHVDGTARPQIIDEVTAPDFYAILQAYYALTGIPSLINTSFNMHEEPIVCSPTDALRSFQQGHLDYLAIGHWIVAHPQLSKHNLEPTLTALAQ